MRLLVSVGSLQPSYRTPKSWTLAIEHSQLKVQFQVKRVKTLFKNTPATQYNSQLSIYVLNSCCITKNGVKHTLELDRSGVLPVFEHLERFNWMEEMCLMLQEWFEKFLEEFLWILIHCSCFLNSYNQTELIIFCLNFEVNCYCKLKHAAS